MQLVEDAHVLESNVARVVPLIDISATEKRMEKPKGACRPFDWDDPKLRERLMSCQLLNDNNQPFDSLKVDDRSEQPNVSE